MSSPLALHLNATAHLDDAASGIVPNKRGPHRAETKPSASKEHDKVVQTEPQTQPQVTVALSFAFDTLTQSLNVIMTNKISGEVVRKISYKSLPTEVHKAEKLNGLLLDQFA